ncbi:MAG TPA: hypothetical protein VFG05_07755 [Methylocella sp.]|nr:hypothetical protein [Methylocella sp.]
MRIFVLLMLGLAVLGILWPSKLRAGLSVMGLIALLAAIGFLAVIILNLPSPPYR